MGDVEAPQDRPLDLYAALPADFVEVGVLPSIDADDAAGDASVPSATTLPAEPGWSLWGDAEV